MPDVAISQQIILENVSVQKGAEVNFDKGTRKLILAVKFNIPVSPGEAGKVLGIIQSGLPIQVRLASYQGEMFNGE